MEPMKDSASRDAMMIAELTARSEEQSLIIDTLNEQLQRRTQESYESSLNLKRVERERDRLKMRVEQYESLSAQPETPMAELPEPPKLASKD